MNNTFVVTAPRGCTDLLIKELRKIGVQDIRQRWGGAQFIGSVALAYKVCLWSRIANRVLMPLIEFEIGSTEDVYTGAKQIDWMNHLKVDGKLAVDCQIFRSPVISHSHYVALKVKDAVVDQFRDKKGARPSVDVKNPDIRIHVRINEKLANICIDLSGESLHRRAYRKNGNVAPLKENIAAAILYRSGWPEVAVSQGQLLDPMCGSGTLVIEAALMALDIAPGLFRSKPGFIGWNQHKDSEWHEILEEAKDRRMNFQTSTLTLVGSDKESRAIADALANAERAGVSKHVQFLEQDFRESKPPNENGGLLVTNPPYGERLGSERELRSLYADLGTLIKTRFDGWKAAVFTGRHDLGKELGMRAILTNKFNNGSIDCRLFRFEVNKKYFVSMKPTKKNVSAGAQMLANRLKKNLRLLGRWARRKEINCYRLYDADLPEYALAIDLYRGKHLWAYVQEYKAPKKIDVNIAKTRLEEALKILPETLAIAPERIRFKVRERQHGSDQYERANVHGNFYEVSEGKGRFWVNFDDYIDTGLFLDHRLVRDLIGLRSFGRNFLNLFSYTGTASVFAALGGALSTTTVDMSKTYIDWAKRNFALNGLALETNHFYQANCLEWLKKSHKDRYGLIFVDPPTFSNSKRMNGHFDIQRDYVRLLHDVGRLLSDGGEIIFSTNFRRFKMDISEFSKWHLQDLTPQTIDRDFERRSNIHACWSLKKLM